MTIKTLPYQLMEQKDYSRMPWKNGLGETLEILRVEDEQGVRIRISQAAVVEDGVFSDFSGLERTLVLIKGAGMRLTHQTPTSATETPYATHRLSHLLDMAQFDGGALTTAYLQQGAIDDLNIMVRQADTQATVQACLQPMRTELRENALLCGFYATEACECRIEVDGDWLTLHVAQDGFLRLEQIPQFEMRAGQGVLVQVAACPT